MDPAPHPGPPRSIRAWGWVLIALSFLDLLFFAVGALMAAASPGSRISVVTTVVLLGTLATGIGFVTGWRWSWLTGLMLGIAGVTFGGWTIWEIARDGADITMVGLPDEVILFLIFPSLFLLVCLFLPASLRWVGVARQEDLATPLLQPGALPAPPRRSLLLPVSVLMAALVVGAWFWVGRGEGAFPRSATGFDLVWSRTVRAGAPFGPPVGTVQAMAKQRLAQYTDGVASIEVRVTELDVTSFTHVQLLEAAGIGIVTTPGDPDGHVGTTTAETIDGVLHTCVRTKVASGCIWTTGSTVGWALGEGQTRIADLRALSAAVHDAVV